MLANTPVTIYNRVQDFATEDVVYLRTVLPAVHWEGGAVSKDNGKSHAKDQSVFASISPMDCSGMTKQYIPAAQFASLTRSEQARYWTIALGDILLKGSVADDIPDGGFRKWMADHPDAATISSFETFDYGTPRMKHWEVYAK